VSIRAVARLVNVPMPISAIVCRSSAGRPWNCAEGPKRQPPGHEHPRPARARHSGWTAYVARNEAQNLVLRDHGHDALQLGRPLVGAIIDLEAAAAVRLHCCRSFAWLQEQGACVSNVVRSGPHVSAAPGRCSSPETTDEGVMLIGSLPYCTSPRP